MIVTFIALIATIITIAILRATHKNESNPVTEPITEKITTAHWVTETDPTVTSTITDDTTLKPTAPANWLVGYKEWSIDSKPLNCTPATRNSIDKENIWTVSIDSVESGCQTVNALRNLQSNSGIHYNFYIIPTGIIYEGYGFSCAPEYSTRYSRNNIIVAICGPLNNLQQTTLDLLLDLGSRTKHLRSDFNIIPECCRGFINRRGPGNKINSYLKDKFSSEKNIRFQNVLCLQNTNCINSSNTEEK